MSTALRTEADLLRTLEAGTYTVGDLYKLAERAGLADRPGGRKRIQDGKEQYKRRVRAALQTLRKQGKAQRVGDGAASWVIEGTVARPRRALFVWLPVDPSQIELVLGDAADVLSRADEPIDLILADPPWALNRGRKDAGYQRTYARNHEQVVDGYVEVNTDEYAEFTARWIAAAGKVLRPGGYLAVVTGPQQSARVQVAAEDAGLTYVNSISVARQFGVYCTRRYVHQHTRVTLMTNGTLTSDRRVFQRPDEMPRGSKGEIYATDVWNDIPEERRPGLLRYDNALPVKLASRVIRSTTNPGDLVADPFLGSGTTAVAALQDGRRFFGGDANPGSLRFTMGRMLAEVVPSLEGHRHSDRNLAVEQLTLAIGDFLAGGTNH
jgi:DNA modification methylase